MDRRQFVSAAAAGLVGALVENAIADDDHAHHSAKSNLPSSKLDSGKVDKLRKETAQCLSAAQSCIGLCNRVAISGDASMADCQASVINLVSVVRGLNEILAWGTASDQEIKSLAAACSVFCADCSAECDKHASHHKECKQCKQACDSCKKACDAIVA
jgi:Cys-rich four helix bundle protein (predicted Tat secretion target)